MDKAGAYGVQGLGRAAGGAACDGDFFNVMGLPVLRLSRMLERFGVRFFWLILRSGGVSFEEIFSKNTDSGCCSPRR